MTKTATFACLHAIISRLCRFKPHALTRLLVWCNGPVIYVSKYKFPDCELKLFDSLQA